MPKYHQTDELTEDKQEKEGPHALSHPHSGDRLPECSESDPEHFPEPSKEASDQLPESANDCSSPPAAYLHIDCKAHAEGQDRDVG